MPLSHIHLRAGRSEAELAALSDSLHHALVHAFDVPEHDRFQVIHQHDAATLIYDRDYAGGPRSEAFVLFEIHAGKPRSAATKQRFYQALVTRLAAAPGVRPEDVMIVISTSTREDWSFSHGIPFAQPDKEATAC